MPITTHKISLHGLSGAIFWCVLSAVIFYVLGFATVDWEYNRSGLSVGLWTTCERGNGHSYKNPNDKDWFTATQAMITIGLILLIASAITISIYMFVHAFDLNKTVLIIVFTALSLAAVLFMLIGFIIFGTKHYRGSLNWSYAFSVIGAILCLIGGIMAIVQMKKSNVV